MKFTGKLFKFYEKIHIVKAKFDFIA